MSLYDITVQDRAKNEVSLKKYQEKVLLIVNTATGCGFTPQYPGLQKLYDAYRDQGFEILDFPCNQFANQAPGTDEEIHNFCSGRFGVTFEQFAKVDVNGKGAAPLFRWLKKKKGSLFGSGIKWNFTKFLVDREGRVVSRFGPGVTPEQIEASVAALL